jgi:hypothetical protein
MADQIRVALISIPELQRDFKLFNLRVSGGVKIALQGSALNVMNEAKRQAPVDTGLLRASIRPTFYNNGLTVQVGSDVFYAPFVEFGTGRRGASSNHPPLPDTYAHGPKPGRKATPYLWPAAELERPKLIAKLKDIFK